MSARNLLADMNNETEDSTPRITAGLRTPPTQQVMGSSTTTPPASQASTVPRGFMNGGGGRARGRAHPASMIPPPARDPRTDPRIAPRRERRSAAEEEDEDADMPPRGVPATGGVISLNPADGNNSADEMSSTASNMDDPRANDAAVPPIADTGNGRTYSSAFKHTDAQNQRNVRMRASLENNTSNVLDRAIERGTNASVAREEWKKSQVDLRDVTEIQGLISNSVLEQVADIPNTAKIYDSLELMNDDKWQQLVRAELVGDARVTGDCLDFIEVLLKRLRDMNTKIVVDMQTKASSTMAIEGMYDLLVVTYNKCVTRKKEMKVKS